MPAASSAPRLRRVLGLVEVTASGVGIIIGAGIYVLLGAATQEAGAGVWLSFGLAALLCGLTGLSYAELASMYPRAGAEYDYARHAFSERVAFLVGWTMVVGLVVAAAAIAVGFAHYLRYFVTLPLVPAAVGLLTFDALIALRGIKRSARLTLALSTVQVAGLLIVIAIGLPHVGDKSLLAGATTGGVVGGAALVFFAFIGFDEVITLSEETKDPTRAIPRALLLALGISTLLYMAVAVAAVSVIGAEGVAGSTRPLASVMAHALGGRAEGTVAAIALLTTTNTCLLALTAASRLVFGMAGAAALPSRLAFVSTKTGAPNAAILVAGLGAVAFALMGDLTFIASVTDFAVYIVFLAVNAAVIILRRREPTALRPFRSPGSIKGVPLLPIAGLVATLAMIPQLSPPALALGSLLTIAGLAGYRLFDRNAKARDSSDPAAGANGPTSAPRALAP